MKHLMEITATHLLRHVLVLIAVGITACSEKDSMIDSYPFPAEPVFFDHVPVDLAGVSSFIAMGEPNVMRKEHGGFPLKNPSALPANIPVFAVASGVIILAGHGTRYIDNPSIPNHGKAYDDYHLRLMISQNVIVNYAHISALNFDVLPELKKSLPADEISRHVQWSRQLAIVYDHLKSNRVFADGSPMRAVPGIEGPVSPRISGG